MSENSSWHLTTFTSLVPIGIVVVVEIKYFEFVIPSSETTPLKGQVTAAIGATQSKPPP